MCIYINNLILTRVLFTRLYSNHITDKPQVINKGENN